MVSIKREKKYFSSFSCTNRSSEIAASPRKPPLVVQYKQNTTAKILKISEPITTHFNVLTVVLHLSVNPLFIPLGNLEQLSLSHNHSERSDRPCYPHCGSIHAVKNGHKRGEKSAGFPICLRLKLASVLLHFSKRISHLRMSVRGIFSESVIKVDRNAKCLASIDLMIKNLGIG